MNNGSRLQPAVRKLYISLSILGYIALPIFIRRGYLLSGKTGRSGLVLANARKQLGQCRSQLGQGYSRKFSTSFCISTLERHL